MRWSLRLESRLDVGSERSLGRGAVPVKAQGKSKFRRPRLGFIDAVGPSRWCLRTFLKPGFSYRTVTLLFLP